MRLTSREWALIVAVPYRGAQCLLWPFGLTKAGYGQTWEAGGCRTAHTLVCTAAHGPRPSPLYEVCHSCGVKACVSPAHLRWDTKKNNQADRRKHGTISVNRGEAHGGAKLNNEKVLAIRASTEPADVLAARYAVSKATIGLVRGRRIWVHV